MFQVGDYIIYGSQGVCRVEKIGKLDSAVVQKDRVYYTLIPRYVKGSSIFTPVDNHKVLMRSVMKKDEAIHLIDNIQDIDVLWIKDEKTREMEYKEAIRKCDAKELIRIIKTIYMRRQARIADGKKVTASDEKYFHIAEESLYGELAISLGMEKEEARKFVVQRVEVRMDKQE